MALDSTVLPVRTGTETTTGLLGQDVIALVAFIKQVVALLNSTAGAATGAATQAASAAAAAGAATTQAGQAATLAAAAVQPSALTQALAALLASTDFATAVKALLVPVNLPGLDATGLTVLSFTDAVGATPGILKDNDAGLNTKFAAYLNTSAGTALVKSLAGTTSSSTSSTGSTSTGTTSSGSTTTGSTGSTGSTGTSSATATEQLLTVTADNVAYTKSFPMAANLNSVQFSYGTFADGSTLLNPQLHLRRPANATGSFPNLTTSDNVASKPAYFADMTQNVYPFYLTGTKSSDNSAYTGADISATCQYVASTTSSTSTTTTTPASSGTSTEQMLRIVSGSTTYATSFTLGAPNDSVKFDNTNTFADGTALTNRQVSLRSFPAGSGVFFQGNGGNTVSATPPQGLGGMNVNGAYVLYETGTKADGSTYTGPDLTITRA